MGMENMGMGEGDIGKRNVRMGPGEGDMRKGMGNVGVGKGDKKKGNMGMGKEDKGKGNMKMGEEGIWGGGNMGKGNYGLERLLDMVETPSSPKMASGSRLSAGTTEPR
ncbi:hypothetical protein EDB84DRAFT_1440711 [Lactarius hengduanensis]|nr:hypothetical protein EDB84DRAFT_1440711 [Lactarius hengduanensis]